MWCGQAQTFKQRHLTHTHAQTNKAEHLILKMKCEQSDALNYFIFYWFLKLVYTSNFSKSWGMMLSHHQMWGLENV